jgi:hypothetical protein
MYYMDNIIPVCTTLLLIGSALTGISLGE